MCVWTLLICWMLEGFKREELRSPPAPALAVYSLIEQLPSNPSRPV